MKVIKVIVFIIMIPLLYLLLNLKSLGKAKKYKGELISGIWYELFPDGLLNSYGKQSPFFVRKGSENKLMVYFCGGGVSWSEKSAAKPMTIPKMIFSVVTYYTPKAFFFVRSLMTGILSLNPKNPFKDWNMVFIPYVTGDFYLGNNEFKYKNGKKTLYHAGENNTRLLMEELKKIFPETDILFICGESAGAFGAAGNASLVAGYYPDTPVVVYSDASQLVVPLWRKTAEEVWKVNEKMLAKIGEDGDLYYDLVEYSHSELGDRAVFLRSNTYYDDVLIHFGSTLRGGPHTATPEAIKYFHDDLIATEEKLEKSGIPYYSFLSSHNKNKKTGLTQHTMCHGEKSFYYKDDVGISLSEWLTDAVNGKYQNISESGQKYGDGK